MDKWIVHKFGGSSVADAACFRRVAEIIEASPNPREAVVLSACRGVTDALLGLITLAERPGADAPGADAPGGDYAAALDVLKARHAGLASELVSAASGAGYREQLERDCRDILGMLQTVRLIRSAPQAMRDVIGGMAKSGPRGCSRRSFANVPGSAATCSGWMPARSSSSNGARWDRPCNGRSANRICSASSRRDSPAA